MNRLRMIIAVVLAALWLPATQHCGLEAAGVLAEQCAEEGGAGHCGTNGACVSDGCGTLEGGDYRSDLAPLKVGSPLLVASVFPSFVPVALASSEAEPGIGFVGGDPSERPRDWVPSWSFARRAAAPAHAPDVLIA